MVGGHAPVEFGVPVEVDQVSGRDRWVVLLDITERPTVPHDHHIGVLFVQTEESASVLPIQAPAGSVVVVPGSLADAVDDRLRDQQPVERALS